MVVATLRPHVVDFSRPAGGHVCDRWRCMLLATVLGEFLTDSASSGPYQAWEPGTRSCGKGFCQNDIGRCWRGLYQLIGEVTHSTVANNIQVKTHSANFHEPKYFILPHELGMGRKPCLYPLERPRNRGDWARNDRDRSPASGRIKNVLFILNLASVIILFANSCKGCRLATCV